MPQISYNKTVKIVDNWMVNSGVRRFCSEVCKGRCCRSVVSHQVCKKREECKNINCVSFLCFEIIRNIFSPEQHLKYRKSNDYIRQITTNDFAMLAFGDAYFINYRGGRHKKLKFDSEKIDFFTKPFILTEEMERLIKKELRIKC